MGIIDCKSISSYVASCTLVLMFITGGRRGKADLGSTQKFVTGTEKEPLLGFKLHPSLFFIKTNKKNFLSSSNTYTNRLSLPRATAEYNLPDEKTLFHLYDYAFVNQYFGQQQAIVNY